MKGSCTTSASKRRSPAAFTLTELMVSVAVLMIAMVAVGYIFTSVSKTSGITTGTIELTDTIETMRQTMQADLDAMAPGILIIDSPDPLSLSNGTVSEPTFIVDAVGEEATYPCRRDRLVFLTSTAPGTYQSWVDPTESSGEAIIHYGHAGHYYPKRGVVDPTWLAPTAYERMLLRRITLLGTQQGPAQFPLGLITGTPEQLRIHLSAEDSVQETLSDLLTRLRDPDYETTADIRMMYARSLAGESTSNVYYGVLNMADFTEEFKAVWRRELRHCFEFLPRVGDFIVEWTDGAIAVGGGRLWYGLELDGNHDGDLDDPVDVIPMSGATGNGADEWRADALYGGFSFEQRPELVSPPDYAGYRAVWRVDGDTWHLRPKALRITVRLYDANKRILDADERLGREYSFVLQVP